MFQTREKVLFGFPSSHPPVLANERTKLWPTANFSSRAKITTVYMTWRARGSRRISGIQTRHLWNVNSANENPIFEMMRIMNNSNILQSFPSALVICLWYKEICFSSFDYRDFWEGSGKSGENNVDEKKSIFRSTFHRRFRRDHVEKSIGKYYLPSSEKRVQENWCYLFAWRKK